MLGAEKEAPRRSAQLFALVLMANWQLLQLDISDQSGGFFSDMSQNIPERQRDTFHGQEAERILFRPGYEEINGRRTLTRNRLSQRRRVFFVSIIF